MTNLARLKLELANREYYTEAEYIVFLNEQGLDPIKEYVKVTDQFALLNTVIDILQTLTNNIDNFRKIETEFITNSSAYANLKNRIDELYKRISLLPQYAPTVDKLSYLYHN